MSVTPYIWFLLCDGCRGIGVYIYIPVEQARTFLREESGWSCFEGEDFCDRCTQKNNEQLIIDLVSAPSEEV